LSRPLNISRSSTVLGLRILVPPKICSSVALLFASSQSKRFGLYYITLSIIVFIKPLLKIIVLLFNPIAFLSAVCNATKSVLH